ncbi:MAG: HU family DNA-binding protein [Deltaproteobacteria bacterium]|nr:HU family DNA-binding protein [Deltaproteobacteria bacterium]
MNTSDLVERLRSEMGYSEAEAERIVAALVDSITESLSSGDKISLPGVGTMAVVDRAPRKGRHPRSGEELDIPAARGVRFSPAAKLKTAVMSLDFITRDLE